MFPDAESDDGPPLDWMAVTDLHAGASDQLAAGPGVAAALVAGLGLASADERERSVSWLDDLCSRAQDRADDRTALVAGHLRAAIDEGFSRRAVDALEESAAASDANLEVTLVSTAGRAASRYLETGDVRRGLQALSGALSDAQAARQDEIECLLRTLLASASLDAGDSEQLHRHLSRVEQLGATLPAVATLRDAVRATWLAASGEMAAANETFRRLRDRADAEDGWSAPTATAFEADAVALVDPEDQARVAGLLEQSEHGHLPSWVVARLRRGAARTLVASGRAEDALRTLRGEHEPDRHPSPDDSETARTTMVVAEALAATGRVGEALELLRSSVPILEGAGATLHQVEALIMLADLDDGDDATAALSTADELSTGDRLFDVLWLRRPAFEVTMIGNRTISVGGSALEMSVKPEQLVLSLLLAGDHGAHWETVATWLWPDEADMGKLKSRISSTTNLARKALGREGWRLVRDGPMLHIRRRGLVCDVDDERDACERPGPTPESLSRPLLPEWSDLEWVEDAELARDALRSR